MSMFKDREKAAERKFEQEQELAFRVVARRNKLFGLWAAARLGLVGDAAQRYATEFVQAEVTDHADAAVIERIMDDLSAADVRCSDTEIREEFAHCAARARAQLIAESGRG